MVNTSAGFGGECHLDAVMVRSGLSRLPLRRTGTAHYRERGEPGLPGRVPGGEQARAMVYAITEGEEKPSSTP